jgi:tripartite-type tricarboxylate transporter receptor subunit TctC
MKRLLCVMAFWLAGAVCAQGYPSKPIKFVVGFPPGGSGDFVARTVGEAVAS